MPLYTSPDGEKSVFRPSKIEIAVLQGEGASLQTIHNPTDEQLIQNGWKIKSDEERRKEIAMAAKVAYENALSKCYFGRELAAYMFCEGMKYQRTGIAPKNDLMEALERALVESGDEVHKES